MRYANCDDALRVLASGGSEDMCHQFDAIRQTAMCRAWQIFDQQRPATFKVAVDAAWDEVETACRSHGGIKPEYGFVQAIEHEETIIPTPDPRPAVAQREQQLQSGQDCPICAEMVDAHCRLHGAQDPRACELRDKYWTTPDMDPSDVLAEMTAMITPEQHDTLRRHVQAIMATSPATGGA